MPRPASPPIGLQLARVAKDVSRAFDESLAAAGGSRSQWLIALALRTQPIANQRQLAQAVGIEGATLTHHLNAMEADGLLTRRRDPANRRIHLVELTARGEEAFHRLRRAATGFDRRLRADLSDDDVATLAHLLERLRANVTGDRRAAGATWASR